MPTSVINCSLDRKKILRFFNAMIILGIASFSIALVVYIYLGFFSRYWADDYCFSALALNNGFWGGLKEHYLSWSNRFTAYLLSGFGDLMGIQNVRVYPGVMILLLIAALTWNVKLILTRLRLTNSLLLSIMVGEMATFFILLEAPNLFQSLYWRSGMVSYFSPLIFLSVINALVITQLRDYQLKMKTKWILAIFSAVLIFFGMGTSETFAALLSGYLLLLSIYLLIQFKSLQKIPAFFYLLLLGAFLGGLVILLAPGNQARMQYLNPASDLFTILRLSFMNAWVLLDQSVRGLFIPNLIIFLSIVFLFYQLSTESNYPLINEKTLFIVTGIIISAVWLLVCICAPTAYSMMAFPEPRAIILSRAVIIVMMMLLGGLAGLASHVFMERIVDTCLVSVFILGAMVTIYPIRTAIQNWQQVTPAQVRAEIWDTRKIIIDQALRDGKDYLELTPINSVNGIYELTSDPTFWVNRCAADYFGINSLKAVDHP
jgi:hypothetical protein